MPTAPPARLLTTTSLYVAALLLFDLKNLLAAIRTTAHANMMRSFGLTTPLAGYKIVGLDLPLTTTLATSGFRNSIFRDSTHCLSTLLFSTSYKSLSAPRIIEVRDERVKTGRALVPILFAPLNRTQTPQTRVAPSPRARLFLPQPCECRSR